MLGRVVDGKVLLMNAFGDIVEACWVAMWDHFSQVALEASVLVPNHVRGTSWIVDNGGCRGTACCAPTTSEQVGDSVPGSIPPVIRSFKSAITRHINIQRGTSGEPVWGRSSNEQIMGTECVLRPIRCYTTDSPLRRRLDRYDSGAVGPGPVAYDVRCLMQDNANTRLLEGPQAGAPEEATMTQTDVPTTIADLPDGYRLTEVGPLPEEWRVARSGDVASQRKGTVSPSEVPDARYAGLEHIDSGEITIRRFGLATEPKSAKIIHQQGGILSGKSPPYLDKAALAD